MSKRKSNQRNARISHETPRVLAKKVSRHNDWILGNREQKDAEELALESLVFGVDNDSFLENLESSSSTLQKGLLLTSDVTEETLGSSLGEEKTNAPIKKKKERKPAWHDDDDDAEDQVASVKVQNDRRYKQIRRNDETKISSQTYKTRLRQRFEKIAGDGSWANLDKEEHKSKKGDSDTDTDDEDGELLRSTGDYLKSSQTLVKGTINFKKCSDLNKEKPSKGRIRTVEFHPSAQVALVAGIDQSLNLFQVDGRHNPQIQSIYMDKFPILTAHFSRDGREVLLGSKHKSFSYYDMIVGKIQHVPHIKGLSSKSHDRMAYFEMSPDGETIAFRGRDGMIYIISAKVSDRSSLSAAVSMQPHLVRYSIQSKEWMGTMKMNGSCEAITFNRDGSRMFSFGSDGDVYVWDMRSQQCLHKFADDGCVRGTTVACSGNSQYLATGSGSGVVNVYDYDQCMTSERPKPLKALLNLTTPCSQVRFNHNSEMLAIASDSAEKAIKLVHFPSLNVFSNFPERTDSMRMPTSCDFSLNSGYLAVGTHTGRAMLYRLKHYGNY